MTYSSTHASLNYLLPYINTHCGNLKRKNLTIMKKNRTFHVRPHSVRRKKVVTLCAILVLLVDSRESCYMKLR